MALSPGLESDPDPNILPAVRDLGYLASKASVFSLIPQGEVTEEINLILSATAGAQQ